MSEYRFAHTIFLLLLLLVPAAWFVPQLRQAQKRVASLRFSDTRLVSGIEAGVRVRWRWLPDALRWGAWCLLVIGLARPQAGNQIDVIRGQGVEIVLALDISTSMGALDFEPDNRLETAKAVIRDFISNRDFDRIGLVVFARTAFQQAPLTLDYDVLRILLDEVQLASALRPVDGRRLDGTAIGLGLASSANMLRAGSSPSQVIILLTDGANNAGLDPIQAAQALKALGIRVYTIGMGRPGPVEIPDASGQRVTIESDLNEDVLTEIATLTDGLYFRAENREGLQQIYDRINRLEQSDAERVLFVQWRDYAYIAVALALLLLLLERLLRESVFLRIP